MRIVVDQLTRRVAPRIGVAGIDPETERHARPVAPHNEPVTRALLAENGGPLEIGALVDLGNVTPWPAPPETERHLFSPAAATRVGRLDADDYLALLDRVSSPDVQSIFGPELEHLTRGYALEPDRGTVSLGVLRVERPPRLEIEHRWARLRIVVQIPERVAFQVVDVRFLEENHQRLKGGLIDDVNERMASGVGVFLTVGLGPAVQVLDDDRERRWVNVTGICLADQPLGTSS
jgi:hypothetical protein